MNENPLYKFKVKASNFNNISKAFPKFICHIFGIFDKNQNKWYILDEIELNNKLIIKIFPNVLFTKEETIELIIDFMMSDLKMFHLFISVLIEDYHFSYVLNLYPSLIILYQFLLKSPNTEEAKRCLNRIFKKKRKIHHAIFTGNIFNEISKAIHTCMENFTKENLIKTLAQNMINNQNFQQCYGKYYNIRFDISHCVIDSIIIDWIDISSFKLITKNGKSLLQCIKTNFRNGNNIQFFDTKFDVKKFEAILSILNTQLNIVNPFHRKLVTTGTLKSYIPQHWKVQSILTMNQNYGRIYFLADHIIQSKSYIGDNFEIKFHFWNVKNEHVCVKILKKDCQIEEFWRMWTRYKEWRHPHILKFYGLLSSSCGFFREYATGPLIFSVYDNQQDFKFKDVLDVLLGIGSALDFLHGCLRETHNNVNLKSIVKVENVYKLSEPSINESNVEILNYINAFNQHLDPECKEDKFLRDLYGLLLTVVFIYFMNEASFCLEINVSTFEASKCNKEIKSLIFNCMTSGMSVSGFLNQLFKITSNFNETELDEVVVCQYNKYIPEFLKLITRDSQLIPFNEINFSQITLLKEIGDGHFSIVFEGIYKLPNNKEIKVAVKKLKNKIDFSLIKKELRPSMMESHRNVLRSLGYSIYQGSIYFFSELGFSNLLLYLRDRKSFFYRDYLDFSIQICEGMEFLSDYKKFIHRDLAARNILVFKENNNGYSESKVTLKISDFGLTVALKEKDYYKCEPAGHRLWLPSDALETGKFTLKTDIYSFGVLMWEIFTSGKRVELYKNKSDEMLPQLEISESIYKVIKSCWNQNEINRPKDFKTINKILNDEVNV